MQFALLLVDLQIDFIERPGLHPAFKDIIGPITRLLTHARNSSMPVAHARTRIEPSGDNRMPHWRIQDHWECVAGTPGEMPPPELEELDSEPVFHKQFFSAFGHPALAEWLKEREVDGLWIAGLYTHGCIRETVMDAYEKGFEVKVIEDGIASYDPLHGRISRDYLHGRAARFMSCEELLGDTAKEHVHFNPAEPEQEVVRIKRSNQGAIDTAVRRANEAARSWSLTPQGTRRRMLKRFAAKLESDEQYLTEQIIKHLGKPRRETLDELRRARGHIAAAMSLDIEEPFGTTSTTICYQPIGNVAVVTPWNNPVAIPVGKIASALMLGNSIVWKPAVQAAEISQRVMTALKASGIPENLVQVVHGGPAEVEALAAHEDISAVTLTGPEQAGTAVSAICRIGNKPLQAELGGNNAMLVLADADFNNMPAGWARMAFGFAGQRCTALRRFVVEKTAVARFKKRFVEEMRLLTLHDPSREKCVVGPLISPGKRAQVRAAVDSALARGAILLEGAADNQSAGGNYFPPALLCNLEYDDPMVQEELFGPVAVLQEADNFDHGLQLVNSVRQGLLAGIASASDENREHFLDRVKAGIVIDGYGMKIHPAAPFGGRKASQIGPPEHGEWDRQFFSQVQTRYRSEPSC